MKNLIAHILSLAAIGLLCGCSSSAPTRTVNYSVWQKDLETYVRDHGKGDPTALRDIKIADGRNGFAVLGDPLPQNSSDAVGVLLGHRAIAGKPSVIYLVGLLKHEKVEDVRLAVLTIDNGQFHWKISPANPGSLQSYRNYRDALWHRQFPNRPTAPAESLNFPGPQDVFTLDIASERVRVVHPPSGATWAVEATAIADRG